jgi:galactose-1-phosphate uridylyltransferase
MTKSQQLSKALAAPLIQAINIEDLSGERIVEMFQNEEGLHRYIPESIGQTDPRSNEIVLFNPSRATRPKDSPQANRHNDCSICQGKTTAILDYAEMDQGFTFINKNLSPAIYPQASLPESRADGDRPSAAGYPVWGLHLVQWTSSFHDHDWDTMDVADLKIVMRRLGVVERHLLQARFLGVSENISWRDAPGNHGYVSIIKNKGLGSGGSLEHGHQQIIFSNIMPRQMNEHWNFEQQHGRVFTKFLLRENPVNLVVQDLGETVLLVPYFMRRPFNMFLVIKDTSKRYIHQLSNSEHESSARGWRIAITAIKQIMSNHNKESSYNVVTHNGPGAGLYFEFLPHTQSNGGFEHLGMSICQASPEISANQVRETLKYNKVD